LPADDSVAFLQKWLERLDGRRLSDYSLHMHTQERIDGKLEPGEDVEVLVRTRPYSVFMRWRRGARRPLVIDGPTMALAPSSRPATPGCSRRRRASATRVGRSPPFSSQDPPLQSSAVPTRAMS
jgi:hypothetical protein